MNVVTSTAAPSRSTPAVDSLEVWNSRDWISPFVFGMGCVLNGVAYQTFEAAMVGVAVFGIGAGFLFLLGLFRGPELLAYHRMVASSWLAAGLAAIYANMWDDSTQNFSDAAIFYQLSSTGSEGLSLAELATLTEGSLMVWVWRAAYAGVRELGLAQGRYIGVCVNVLCVAFSAVGAVCMVRHALGYDLKRLRRVANLCACCGLFWLFAAIHVRDSMVLLSVTVLSSLWVRFLSKPSSLNLAWVCLATVAGTFVMFYLRAEFRFLPAALGMAATLSRLLFTSAGSSMRMLESWLLFLAILAALASAVVFRDSLLPTIVRAYDDYRDLALGIASDSSMGARLVSAPIPLRLLFGSAYILLFPIPMTNAYYLASAYHVFKSFHALFSYAMLPLLAMAIMNMWKVKALRSPSLMFLLFSCSGALLATAGTSLETRHWGAFLALVLALCAVPDFSVKAERSFYTRLCGLFLLLIMGLHLMWMLLKGA